MQHLLKVATVIAAALAITACEPSQANGQKQQGARSVPVNIVEIAVKPQTIQVELPGRSRAYLEAEVRPQVSGIVLSRTFIEGGVVAQGQSLYQIDPSLYDASLVSAKAQLERAQAAEVSTKATAKRFAELIQTKAVSQQDFDHAEAAYLEAKAQVAVAKAAINSAEINLQYTKVEAPISGRIGKSNITPGGLVTANQSGALAKISQLDPINVDIVQSSAQMLRLKSRIASGQLDQPETTDVTLILEDGSQYPHNGKLKFSEVTVDENTGSVTMRAEFANPDGILLPGMFVRTLLTVGTDPNGILVPQKAIGRNPKGEGIAMVVNDQNKVEMRIVTTAESIGHDWLISNGLKAGDKLIVEGLQKIRSGAAVTANVISATNHTAQKQ